MSRIRTFMLPVAGLVRTGAWGIPDQALISLSNFVTTIFLARALTPERFGEFAVAFSFVTVALALASAALTQPFVVLSARYEGDQNRRFCKATLLAHLLVILAVATAFAAGSSLAALLGWRLAALAAFTIPAFAGWQLQEFVRQVFYTENRLREAFFNDILCYGGQVIAFILAYSAGVLTPISALLIIAVGFTVATGEGVWLLRRSLAGSLSQSEFKEFMREAWNFGRWTFAHATIGSVTGFYIVLILATFSGSAAAGVLRAFVATTAPMRVLIAGAKTSYGPSAANIAAREGVAGLQPYIRRVFMLVGPAVTLYCLLLALLARPALDLVFGGRFDDYAHLLPLFIAAYFITEIFFAIEIGLRACRVTDVLVRASLVATIGTWILGPPLTHFYGLSGLLWLALTLAPFSGAMLWLRYQQEVRRRKQFFIGRGINQSLFRNY